MTEKSHDRVVSTQSGPFVDHEDNCVRKQKHFALWKTTLLNGLRYILQMQNQFLRGSSHRFSNGTLFFITNYKDEKIVYIALFLYTADFKHPGIRKCSHEFVLPLPLPTARSVPVKMRQRNDEDFRKNEVPAEGLMFPARSQGVPIRTGSPRCPLQ